MVILAAGLLALGAWASAAQAEEQPTPSATPAVAAPPEALATGVPAAAPVPISAALGDEEAPRRIVVNGFLWTTSPVALHPGLVLGGGLEGRRLLGDHGLYLGARLAFGGTSAATQEWDLLHLHGLADAVAGIEGKLGGVGLVRAQLNAGALVIRQIGKRQQFGRLQQAGYTDLTRDGWSTGPYLGADVGAEIAFDAPWRAFLTVGPAYTVQTVEGQRAGHWIVSTSLGVGYAF